MSVTAERARVKRLAQGGEDDPFDFLGMHRTPEGGLVVRAFRPKAESLELIDARTGASVGLFRWVHPDGVFLLELPPGEPFPYRLREHHGVAAVEFEDPYRFGKVLDDRDTQLIHEGNHLRLWEVLGAHLRELEGAQGTTFAVWAPNARRVSVVGDFNDWDGRVHGMRFRAECGVWEIFIPIELAGRYYKYELVGPDGNLLPLRADPVGFAHELRPATASIVEPPSAHIWGDAQWMEGRGETSRRDRPIAIYEVHLGSWRSEGVQGDMPTYRELADTLLPYVRDLGFTHIELLPITEHPFDGSWGYQTTGMYAPTSRHGSPDDFRAFVDRAHAEGIGVIFDWVPGHFPADTHGLVFFDGTHLYEHMDRRKSFNVEWGTYSYNFDRVEVSNFLVASALFWLEQFHIDGLRVDAVSSIVYLDYGRQYGEWLPNLRGSNENLEATAFLRRFNTTVYNEFPTAMTIAEESTAFPMVSWPSDAGGLGFGYKWNMGWMHDTLRFFSFDPLVRGHHLNEVSFGILYAWSENFILPFSHDEVVHLKRSLLGRMPGGDDERRFASLRALYAFMYTHPGKKLMFMGGEFAQEGEWNESFHSLDWYQLEDDPRRKGVHALVHDLNRFYRESPALYASDAEPAGFEWIDCTDATNAVISFVRRDPKSSAFLVIVLNASGVLHQDYRIGVPQGGTYRERLNTDAAVYGGGNCGNEGQVTATSPGANERPYTLSLTLPPQSILVLEPA
jgi:1,4-alpha-glucan branching enzyme